MTLPGVSPELLAAVPAPLTTPSYAPGENFSASGDGSASGSGASAMVQPVSLPGGEGIGQGLAQYTGVPGANPYLAGPGADGYGSGASTSPYTGTAQTAASSGAAGAAIQPDTGPDKNLPAYQPTPEAQASMAADWAQLAAMAAQDVQRDAGSHDLTPDELAALLAKWAQPDPFFAGQGTAPTPAPAPSAPVSDPAAIAPWPAAPAATSSGLPGGVPPPVTGPPPAGAQPPPAASPLVTPAPGAHPPPPVPLPPVSPTAPLDYSLYFPPGVVYQQFDAAVSGAMDPANPVWARVTLGLLAVPALPLAAAEELIGRTILNAPFAIANTPTVVINAGTHIGEYGARSALNFSRGETGEGVIDALNSVASFSQGFTAAAQVTAPIAGALENSTLSSVGRLEPTPLPPEVSQTPAPFGLGQTPAPSGLGQTPVSPGLALSPTSRIIDANVFARASDLGNANALAAIRSGDPVVTLSQLREFLDVTSEVQQTQRAQFLLDEGVTPLSTQYGQLTDPQLTKTFWDIANQQGGHDTTGDAALVIHGLQSGLPIVTGDGRLIRTVQDTLKIPGVTFVRVTW